MRLITASARVSAVRTACARCRPFSGGRTTTLVVLGITLSACSASAPAPGHPALPYPAGTVAIAKPTDALTFARIVSGGGIRVIAVTRFSDGVVEGIDIGAALGRAIDDPIAPFLGEGYDRLANAIADAVPSARVTVRATDLTTPVDLRDHHVATGLNFPAHAGESGVGDGPFLFPKTTAPTGPYAPVSVGNALLDYEVEVGWVTLAPLGHGQRPDHLGVVLCNDYTDRDLLLRSLDPWDPTSGKGFTTGKSFPGSLPIGNLFVIPRDYRAFASGLELRLWVNGRLRQRAPLRAAVWNVEGLIDETWRRRDLAWQHRGEDVRLPIEDGRIPARTLLMSGTPDGTIFQAITSGQKLHGAGAWALGLFRGSLPAHVVGAYIRDARAERIYLQPADRVAIHVESLGTIENEVIP
jgi:2,4-didehydro-3-deoxy-L-rhamnonate hydrolase